MNLLINFLVKSCILAKDAQKEVDLHLDVRKIAIPFFYGRYLWITSFGTIIHSPQKLWQGLDMKRIAIISAETRNSKKEVFFFLAVCESEDIFAFSHYGSARRIFCN